MARSRKIRSDISRDKRIAALALAGDDAAQGTLALLLYTWAVPCADDWGRITGDATEFRLSVAASLPVTDGEVEACLRLIAEVGLWTRYESASDGRSYIAFPWEAWCRHQTDVPKARRAQAGGIVPPPPGFEAEGAPAPTAAAAERDVPTAAQSPAPAIPAKEDIPAPPYLPAPPGPGKKAPKADPLAELRPYYAAFRQARFPGKDAEFWSGGTDAAITRERQTLREWADTPTVTPEGVRQMTCATVRRFGDVRYVPGPHVVAKHWDTTAEWLDSGEAAGGEGSPPVRQARREVRIYEDD